MNPTTLPLTFTSDQVLAMMNMQMLQAAQLHQQPFPAGYPAVASQPMLQPDNFRGTQGFYPNFLGLQMQPSTQLLAHMPTEQQYQPTLPSSFTPTPLARADHYMPRLFSQQDPSKSEKTALEQEVTSFDDHILALTLQQGQGEGLEDILRPLDGLNGHSTVEWVSHYIKNTNRIQKLVREMDTTSHPKPSIPRPPVSSFDPKRSSGSRLKQTGGRPGHNKPHPSSLRKPRATRPPSPRPHPRRDSHALTAPDIILTEKEMTYLGGYLARSLRCDPNALDSLDFICYKLGQQPEVQNHSAYTLKMYLEKHQIIPKIRRRVLAEEHIFNDSILGHGHGFPETVTHEKREIDSEESPIDDNVSITSSVNAGELLDQDRAYRKSRGTRPAYLPSEQRALAKHIANITLDQWDNSHEAWLVFGRKHTGHTVSAWKKWYSVARCKEKIERMARRYEIRNAMRKSLGDVHHSIATPFLSLSGDTSSTTRLSGPETRPMPETDEDFYEKRFLELDDRKPFIETPHNGDSQSAPSLVVVTQCDGDAQIQHSPSLIMVSQHGDAQIQCSPSPVMATQPKHNEDDQIQRSVMRTP